MRASVRLQHQDNGDEKAATKATAKLRRATAPLVFVDTNIYLDFYRARNETGLKLLDHLDQVRDNLISTYQVEMEFKKNRQNVIVESYAAMRLPETVTQPAFLAEAASVKALRKNVEDAKKRVKAVKQRLKNILANPTTHDPVYRVAQRIFTADHPLNLRRENDQKFSIRRLAFKRFILGYPPRKKGDTSTGDAVNWEWIIHCASSRTSDIVIVSRDSDFGVTVDDESFLNDWLEQEFKSRVSRRRKITLTHKLSHALKMLAVSVTQQEEDAEDALAVPRPTATAAPPANLQCEVCRHSFSLTDIQYVHVEPQQQAGRTTTNDFMLVCTGCLAQQDAESP